MAGFAGFGARSIRWFKALEKNNTRDWFLANRAVFDAEIKAPMAALLEAAAARHGGEAKVFRQNRDVRFSKDKSPYKTAIYGGVYGGVAMGLYACLDARGFFAGIGAYVFAPDQLSRYRDAVDAEESGAALVRALAGAEAAGATLEEGDALKSAPRGYDKEHPRLDLLRRKNLILGARIGPKEALAGDAPAAFSHRIWQAAKPVADWVDAHVGASASPLGGDRSSAKLDPTEASQDPFARRQRRAAPDPPPGRAHGGVSISTTVRNVAPHTPSAPVAGAHPVSGAALLF